MEFALVLPLVVVCVLGIVQVARITALQVATVNAARTGARAAAIDPRPGVARAAVRGAGAPSNVEVTMRVEPGEPRLVTIRVRRSVVAVPLVGWSTVHLRAAATMAVEDPTSDRGG